jgi:hypothetical protein
MVNDLFSSIDPDALRNVALGLSGGSLLLALVALKVLKSMVMRVVGLVVFVALSLAMFAQRSELQSCVESAKNAASGLTSNSDTASQFNCTFLGFDVDVTP